VSSLWISPDKSGQVVKVFLSGYEELTQRKSGEPQSYTEKKDSVIVTKSFLVSLIITQG
jgi:hypothetical protein